LIDPIVFLTDPRVPDYYRTRLQSMHLERDILESRGVTVRDATQAGDRLRQLRRRIYTLSVASEPFLTAPMESAKSTAGALVWSGETDETSERHELNPDEAPEWLSGASAARREKQTRSTSTTAGWILVALGVVALAITGAIALK